MCKQAAALHALIQKLIYALHKSADFFTSHYSEFFLRTNVPPNVFPAFNDSVEDESLDL